MLSCSSQDHFKHETSPDRPESTKERNDERKQVQRSSLAEQVEYGGSDRALCVRVTDAFASLQKRFHEQDRGHRGEAQGHEP